VSLYIETLDDNNYELEFIGLQPKSFKVDPLLPRATSETLDGVDGFIDVETTFEGRSLRATFLISAKSLDHYIHLRNFIHKTFDGKTYFYIIEKNDPSKRWKVKTVSQYNIERINPVTGMFEVEFISPSPYAESRLSTSSPYIASNNRGFNETSFSLWNEGDISVDPRVFPLVITFKGTSSNLIIRNKTTGDEWQYLGNTVSDDLIILDGIRATKNNISIFGQTNRKLITLAVGINEFEIIGATSPFEVTFDFRYYYI
jgi:hypothetical protein